MTEHTASVGTDRTEGDERRSYEPPSVTEIGSIEEVTLGFAGGGQDFETAVSPLPA